MVLAPTILTLLLGAVELSRHLGLWYDEDYTLLAVRTPLTTSTSATPERTTAGAPRANFPISPRGGQGSVAMLLKLTGSSCAGKSTLARAVADDLAGGVAVHDSDEIPVPRGTRGRQQAGEWWVRRALAYQAQGVDLLLTSQSPMGEVLATPRRSSSTVSPSAS